MPYSDKLMVRGLTVDHQLYLEQHPGSKNSAILEALDVMVAIKNATDAVSIAYQRGIADALRSLARDLEAGESHALDLVEDAVRAAR